MIKCYAENLLFPWVAPPFSFRIMLRMNNISLKTPFCPPLFLASPLPLLAQCNQLLGDLREGFFDGKRITQEPCRFYLLEERFS
jgi:hypothetical protein